MLSQGERFEYSKETWLAFIRARGSASPAMSSNEWNLLCTWMDTVPLRVVLQAIHQTRHRPKSLLYYEPIVVEEERRRQRALA